jgi:hypothetical protein
MPAAAVCSLSYQHGWRQRPELEQLLAECGVDPELLVYAGRRVSEQTVTYTVNDLRLLQKQRRLKLVRASPAPHAPRSCVLADVRVVWPGSRQVLAAHNSPPEQTLAKSVVQIVDNHFDAGAAPQVQGAARVIGHGATDGLPDGVGVATVCTLVAEVYAREAPELLADEPLVGKLLLGAILSATDGLADGATTDRDREAVRLRHPSTTHEQWRQTMQAARQVDALYASCRGLPGRAGFAQALVARKYDARRWAAVADADLVRACQRSYHSENSQLGYSFSRSAFALRSVAQPRPLCLSVPHPLCGRGWTDGRDRPAGSVRVGIDALLAREDGLGQVHHHSRHHVPHPRPPPWRDD